MAQQNSLNNSTSVFTITTLTGLLTANGASPLTASTVTQYGTVIAGTSNAVTSVAPSATSGVPLISQGSSANPVYGTALVAGGGTGIATATAYSLIAAGTTATGAFQVVGTGTTGQVLVSGGSAALPSWSSVTALTWVDQTSSPVTMAINTGYIMDLGSLITATLPVTAAVGSVLKIIGKGAGKWLIAQAAGQSIVFNSTTTTVGVTGSLAATLASDCMELVCTTANTTWTVSNSAGNITVV